MGLKSKDLLGIRELSVEEIRLVLDTAASMKEIASRDIKKVPALRGKTVINLFYEPSTRTRTSFEIAGKWLSADVINISTSASSVVKGESLKDTGLTLQSMHPDVVVIRHAVPGAPHLLARLLKASIINAGDGAHEHPTQALLDAYTMRRHLADGTGDLSGLRVTIVGDVLHSRVARSNVLLLTTLGAQVTLVAPPTLLPVGVQSWPCEVSYDLDAPLATTDALMMLRVQRERMDAAYFPSEREYSRRYGLDARRAASLPEHAIVMHPGPMNRGMEITAEVADGPRSVIVEQVTNGVSIRMAVLYLLLGGDQIA
jgi:aspartate carbamoyltransferase catalytic subunit